MTDSIDNSTPDPCTRITPEELRTFDIFKDDDDAALTWLAEHFVVHCYEAGERVSTAGDIARELAVILEGEVHFIRANDPSTAPFVRRAGQATGLLPFSRMTVTTGSMVAVQPTRAVLMDGSYLRELVYRAPQLAQKLVNLMVDRARETTQRDERANRMLALGKLSAGLAHELNNPASAVVRSSTRMREVMLERKKHALAMRTVPISPEVQALLLDQSETMAKAAANPEELDPLERSDREEEFASWLRSHDLPTDTAGSLVQAGISVADLEAMFPNVDRNFYEHGLHILATEFETLCLTREIEEASRRIADLVQSIKLYTRMDQMPVSEVDIEEGLKVTLRLFKHKLNDGYEFKKSLAGNLPLVHVNAGELNQVWTNLIDNALDAMCGSEIKRLEIHTCLEPGNVLVEIIDSGPGIPPEVKARMFDAFFTTKPVGQGTGLGLDIVHRIVMDHKGSINVSSVPGRTVFQVRIPIEQQKLQPLQPEPAKV